jgi:hypothetical protein
MKTTLAYLRLYLKAGWWLTAIFALWFLISVVANPRPGSLGWPYSYLVLLIYMPIQAHYFLPVDRLLFYAGLHSFKRMALMFTAWALHFSILAAVFLFALAIKPLLWSMSLSSYYVYIAKFESYASLPLLYLAITLVISFVDLQARRLAGLSTLDSVFFTILGQVAAFVALLACLGVFKPPVIPFAHPQGPLLIPAAAALMALAFVFTRVLCAHSLLKESELP